MDNSRFARWSSGALWVIVFAIHAALGGEWLMSRTNGRL